MKAALRHAVLSFVACMFLAFPCEARLVNVWYDHSAAPAWNSLHDTVAAIQIVMREWEQHNGNGQLILQWRGVIGPGQSWPPESLSDLVIYWDPDEGEDVCARTCRPGNGCSVGRIALTLRGNANLNTQWNRASYRPGSGSGFLEMRCGSLRGDLNHELAHLFRDTATHWSTSVLSIYYDQSSVQHNLWEEDGNASTDYFLPHSMGLEIEVRSPPATGRTTLAFTRPPASADIRAMPTIETGDGESGFNNYAVAYGGTQGSPASRGIAFWRGDGRTWMQTQFLSCNSGGACPNNLTTTRRPCLVNSESGSDYYLVWAAPTQISNGLVGDPINGGRVLMTAESHDRGLTWTNIQAINNAVTRSGVSCTLDPNRGRVVVVYAKADTEELQVVDRPATIPGPNQWSMPQSVLSTDLIFTQDADLVGMTPFSPEVPDVHFDRYSIYSPKPGHITWTDSLKLKVITATFDFFAGRYMFGSARAIRNLNVSPNTFEELMRSGPVLDFEGEPILLMGTNSNYQTRHQVWQFPTDQPAAWRFVDSMTYFVAPGTLRQYGNSASNRSVVETGSVARTILNPS